jgi:hypothetical protein
MAFERAVLGSARDVAPTLTVSRLGFAGMFLQRGVESFGHTGLRQEAKSVWSLALGADTLIGKGRPFTNRNVGRLFA